MKFPDLRANIFSYLVDSYVFCTQIGCKNTLRIS